VRHEAGQVWRTSSTASPAASVLHARRRVHIFEDVPSFGSVIVAFLINKQHSRHLRMHQRYQHAECITSEQPLDYRIECDRHLFLRTRSLLTPFIHPSILPIHRHAVLRSISAPLPRLVHRTPVPSQARHGTVRMNPKTQVRVTAVVQLARPTPAVLS
jgi:hypothetical protein